MINIFAYTGKIPIDLIIWNTKDIQISFFKLNCTKLIFFRCFFFIMLRTIQLYHQSGIMTIKINDILIYHLLTKKSHRVIS